MEVLLWKADALFQEAVHTLLYLLVHLSRGLDTERYHLKERNVEISRVCNGSAGLPLFRGMFVVTLSPLLFTPSLLIVPV